MAIEFKGSWLLVNGTEALAGQVTGFGTKDKYIRYDSNKITETGYTQFEDKTSLKMYIAGYSASTYYITKIKYYTSSPLSSFTINCQCSTNYTSSSSSGKKRGAVLSTNGNLVTSSNYSSFQNTTGIKSFYFSSEKSTITWNETIPAGDFYVYLGPSSTDTSNSSYSTIFAVQADSVKLTYSGVEAPPCTVTFNSNSSENKTYTKTVNYGDTLTFPGCGNNEEINFTPPEGQLYELTLNLNGGNGLNSSENPTAQGNRFRYWSDKKDGTTQYIKGDTTVIKNDVTFYARWESSVIMGIPIKSTNENYTINFDGNGGSCDKSSETSVKTTSYDFKGWATTTNNPSKLYSGTETYWISVNLTRYAIWEETPTITQESIDLTNKATYPTTPKTITITLDSKNGTSTVSKNSTKNSTKEFLGWSTSKNSSTLVTTPYTPQKNGETLYAVWGSEQITYTSIELPTPTKAGYVFQGWATSENASSGITGSYTPESDNNITLYAIWKIGDGNVRIYLGSNKYETALVYIYAPTSTSDTKPWKLVIPYLYTSGTQPWKIIAG